MSVSIPTNTQIFEIAYSSSDPLTAQRGAQTFAEAYLEFKTQQVIEDYTRARTGIQRQIQQLEGQLQDARERLAEAPPGSSKQQEAQGEADLLLSQLAIARNQMGSLSTPQIDPGDVIEPAPLPLQPSSPNHVQAGILALTVGLALGVGLAFLREHLDDRIGGREELEEVVGAPVLAVVPKVSDWKKRQHAELVTRTVPKGATAEAYRTIRTNIQFIAREDNFKVLAITSPGLGEGKTTTTANLAVALAQTGKRVLAVSCDLRKPRLHRFFELHNRVGLANILTGEAALADVAQRCGIDTLRVIASGPIPPNPAELLQSEEMDELLEQFRKAAHFVVIDTAPILAVSDALILAPKSDGVILVADPSVTSRAALSHVRDQLEQIGGNVIGGIFNNFDPATARYYPSYYRYYYSYRYKYKTEGEPEEALPPMVRIPDPEEMWR